MTWSLGDPSERTKTRKQTTQLMKAPGSVQSMSRPHWRSVSRQQQLSHSHTATVGSCCCLNHKEVPLCLRHHPPFWPGQTVNTATHTWHGVAVTQRGALERRGWMEQREEEKRDQCILWNAIPFPHLHLYEFISSWSHCGKRAVSITGRPPWPLWKFCVCLRYLRVCNGQILVPL